MKPPHVSEIFHFLYVIYSLFKTSEEGWRTKGPLVSVKKKNTHLFYLIYNLHGRQKKMARSCSHIFTLNSLPCLESDK